MEEVLIRVREIRGMARCDLGDWDGLEDLREALRMVLRLGLGQETVRTYINLGTFVTPVEGPAKALELYRSAMDFADRRGIALLGMWTRAWSCGVLFELGRWDELISIVREVVKWERDRGPSQFVVGALLCEAEVRTHRGEVELAANLAEEFLARARDIQDPQVLVPALAVAALVKEAQGDPKGAVALIEETRARRGADWTQMLFLQVNVRMAVNAGQMFLGEQLVADVEPRNRREWNSLRTSEAVLAEARGDLPEAIRAYWEAADRWRDYGFALEEGWALLGAGRVLVALGRLEDANDALSRAKRILQDLGAVRLLAEIEALMAGNPGASITP